MFLSVQHYQLRVLFHIKRKVGVFIAGGVRTVVEPVPEAVEAILNQVFRCSKVEPRIDCI